MFMLGLVFRIDSNESPIFIKKFANVPLGNLMTIQNIPVVVPTTEVPSPGFTLDREDYQDIALALAVLYVLSPLDAIPDFVPFLGFMDDAFVIRNSRTIGGLVYDLTH